MKKTQTTKHNNRKYIRRTKQGRPGEKKLATSAEKVKQETRIDDYVTFIGSLMPSTSDIVNALDKDKVIKEYAKMTGYTPQTDRFDCWTAYILGLLTGAGVAMIIIARYLK